MNPPVSAFAVMEDNTTNHIECQSISFGNRKAPEIFLSAVSAVKTTPDRFARISLHLLLAGQNPHGAGCHCLLLELTRILVDRSYETAAFFNPFSDLRELI